jgi:hypothetical protein
MKTAITLAISLILSLAIGSQSEQLPPAAVNNYPSSKRLISVGATTIFLMAPNGLRDYTDSDSIRGRVARAGVTPPTVLVAMFAAENDTAYLLVQKNTAFERKDVSTPEFVAFADAVSRQTIGATNGNDEMTSYKIKENALDDELKLDLDVQVGSPRVLGVTSRSTRHITISQLTRVRTGLPGETSDSVMATTMTIAHIRGKLLNIYYYDKYTGQKSLDALFQRTDEFMRIFWECNAGSHSAF